MIGEPWVKEDKNTMTYIYRQGLIKIKIWEPNEM